MTIKEFDRVLLKDGKEASIIEIFEQDKYFLADVDDEDGETDTTEIAIDDIAKVL